MTEQDLIKTRFPGYKHKSMGDGGAFSKHQRYKSSAPDRIVPARLVQETGRKSKWISFQKKPYFIQWMFTAIIIPILTYGAIVWWRNHIDYHCVTMKRSNIQNLRTIPLLGKPNKNCCRNYVNLFEITRKLPTNTKEVLRSEYILSSVSFSKSNIQLSPKRATKQPRQRQ